MAIKILHNPNDVLGYEQDVVALADCNKQALGFLPRGMYKNQIEKGAVFVAVEEADKEEPFAGYIIVGGRRPEKRIFQLVVKEKHRGKGAGKKLFEEAVNAAKQAEFSSIWVKVGSKLEANDFWASQGLVTIGKQPGGSTHPICLIRAKQIAPSLLGGESAEPGGVAALRRAIDMIRTDSLFVVDTNVYIDAVRNKKEHAHFIFTLEKRGQIQIVRTPAVTGELSAYKGKNGVFNYAMKFPELQVAPDNTVMDKLRDIIFPGKKQLTKNDTADLRSLAAAIAGKATDFVTQDKEVLQKENDIRDYFSLNVWSPGDLWDGEMYAEQSGGAQIAAEPEPKDVFRLESPAGGDLEKAGFKDAAAEKFVWHTALMRGDSMLGVVAAEEINLQTQKISLFLGKNDAQEYTAEILLSSFRKRIVSQSVNVELTLHSSGGAANKAALVHGYVSTGQNKYQKTHAPQIVTRNNWRDYRGALERLNGMQIPADIPEFFSHDQPVRIGKEARVPLDKLENYLSSIFILPGRDGIAIPIKPWFADGFFQHEKQGQLSMLPTPAAELLARKSYLGDKGAASRIQTGMPILFYQSGQDDERGKIIAVARVVRTQIVDTQNMSASEKRRLVLSARNIDEMSSTVLETVFDNGILLPNPVTLDKLREIQCLPPANFVTATKMDAACVYKIVKEGLSK